jgi:murein L,D-transpeptidase YafK
MGAITMKLILSTILFYLSSFSLQAIDLPQVTPAPLVHLENFFGHHILVAEKSSHQLYLFRNQQGKPELIKTYQMATGKKAGDKTFQGDFRTPEGVYKFTEFLSKESLLKRYGKEGEIYGIGSFVMNYPNPIDRKLAKTGGGIWLHSTNDETRIEKGLDSRGCLVAHNKNLKEISKYIELNKTHIIVVQDLKYVSKKVMDNTRREVSESINEWASAWMNEDLEKYLSYYDKKRFSSSINRTFSQFKWYKKNVFSRKGKPTIEVKNLSLLKGDNYMVAIFLQDYESETIKDIGVKTLYFKQNESYEWKIVSENWSKFNEESTKVAFVPSLRFFGADEGEKVD